MLPNIEICLMVLGTREHQSGFKRPLIVPLDLLMKIAQRTSLWDSAAIRCPPSGSYLDVPEGDESWDRCNGRNIDKTQS